MEYYFPAISDGSNFSSSSVITNTNNMNINGGGYKDKMKKGASDHDQKVKSSKVKLSTEPQSVAARERRHRISERFKILQSLVPGGNKMDTVSMLEEAIQYVKFLKNQIRLHQTMINFARDDACHQYYDHDAATGNVFQLPIHHGHPVNRPQQQALCYEQNNFVGTSSSVQPSVPVMPDYSCFQGQEAEPEIDAYLKYYS
ncbi:hypothetical protein ACLB2K_056919 [Fragaria x ananassa]